jgi:hypothetical protein
MTKAELTKEANKAIKIMENNGQKGWKRFIKKRNLATKKKTPATYYGGIYKGSLTIFINKKIKNISYSIYVNDAAPSGIVSTDLHVWSNPCPFRLYRSQIRKIEEQRKLLKSYIDSVK